MGEHWTDRLAAEAKAQKMSLAALDKACGLPDGRARTYKSKRTEHPRGDELARYASVLGVELLWLRDGVEPKRPGDMADTHVDPTQSADEIIHRREVARRIAECRARRGINSVESAALGTGIKARRWRQIETGEISPTPLELMTISNRLHESLDWIVSGSLVPIDSSNPVETEKVRRYIQETAPVKF